jgi:hypothetical protein
VKLAFGKEEDSSFPVLTAKVEYIQTEAGHPKMGR